MKKSDCSASIITSADSEEQDQETCQSSKRLRFNKKKFNYLLYYLQQIKMQK